MITKEIVFFLWQNKNTIPFSYDSAGNIMLCDDNTMAHNTYYLEYDERMHQILHRGIKIQLNPSNLGSK